MTYFRILALGGALLVISTSAQAQTPPLTFDQAAYVTCREAHNMQPEPRKALAVFLRKPAAPRGGVALPPHDLAPHSAPLLRAGSPLPPQTHSLHSAPP